MATPLAFDHGGEPSECGARHCADGRFAWTSPIDSRGRAGRFRISASMESVAKDRAVESALAGAPSHATPSAELTLKVGKRFAVAEEFSLDVAFSAEAGFTIPLCAPPPPHPPIPPS